MAPIYRRHFIFNIHLTFNSIKMKAFSTIVCILLFSVCFSQSRLDTRPLLYRTFIPSIVNMKSGAIEEADLNYNTNNQSLVFFDGKRLLEITGLENISNAKVGNVTFIPVKGKFYQTTRTQNLLVSFSNVKSPRTTTVTKSGVENIESEEGSNNVSNIALVKRYQGENSLVYTRSFWLLKNNNLKSLNSIKDIAKTLNVDKREVELFVNENDVDLRQESGIVLVLKKWDH